MTTSEALQAVIVPLAGAQAVMATAAAAAERARIRQQLLASVVQGTQMQGPQAHPFGDDDDDSDDYDDVSITLTSSPDSDLHLCWH